MARMLEVLLPGKTIRSLEFRPTEQHGLAISDKISNFDAVCTSDTGEMFIVEMQGLVSRYCICSTRTGEVMTESLQFVYLELGRLEAKLGEDGKCRSLTEQLAYSLKYMRELDECPKAFENKLFSLLFRASEYANLDVQKQMQVSTIMRTELDRIAENNYALEKGRAEGKAEGMAEMAVRLRALGVKEELIQAALEPQETQ